MKKFVVFLMTLLISLSCMAVVGCGVKECEHTYGDWVVKTESTCTVKGERYKECTKCGEKVSEDIALNSHSYGGWQTETDPDCCIDGQKKRTCIVCGGIETETIPATGIHNYNNKGVCGYCGNNVCVSIQENVEVNNVKQGKYYYSVNIESENDLTIETLKNTLSVNAISSIKLYENNGTTEIALSKDGNVYKTTALDQGKYYLVVEYALSEVGNDLTLKALVEFTPPYGV